MTHYEILNIRKTATTEEIKDAYKKLVKQYHPDVYPGDKTFAEKKTQEINEAYDILSDEEKHNLIKLYTDLEQSIKTIECYSQSTAMKEKRLIVDQKAIDTFKKHPALMHMTYFNSSRNSSHSLSKDLLHARCFESIKYMFFSM